MGCSGSKDETKAQNKPTEGQETKQQEEDTYITVEEAKAYLVEKLCISEEKAQMIVDKVNKDGDGKIKNAELEDLVKQIDAIRMRLITKFKELDTDDNKWLTKEQAGELFTARYGDDAVHLLRDGGFVSQFDKDKDGKFYYEEMALAYAYLSTRIADLNEQFKEMDRDESGELDSEEFQKLFTDKTGFPPEMAKCFSDGDYNKDGKISKAEFLAFWGKIFPQ